MNHPIDTMPASLWKSLTERFTALGHSLHEAECITAMIVIDCFVMFTIVGYRFSEARTGAVAGLLLWPGNPFHDPAGPLWECPGWCGPGLYPFTLYAGSGTTGKPREVQRNPG
jgi:hypothetical protein